MQLLLNRCILNLYSQLLFYKFTKAVFNFCVTWNRSFLPIFGIHINVVICTMAFKVTSGIC